MPRYVRSVERAVAVLEFVARHGRPAPLGEIREAILAPKSTALNIVRTLVAKNLLAVDATTKQYSPGSLLQSLASQSAQHLDLRSIARPYLERVARATEEGVFLSVLEDLELVYIEKVDSTQAVRYTAHIGTRRPLHCTSAGKVALSTSPPAFVARYLREVALRKYTATTITSREQLREELNRIRTRGYAVSVSEYAADLMGVAAPITDGAGRFRAAVTVAGPAFRMRRRIQLIRDALLGATRAMTAACGGVPVPMLGARQSPGRSDADVGLAAVVGTAVTPTSRRVPRR